MGLTKGPHKIDGLGTFMLLITYLAQTNLTRTISKLSEIMTMIIQKYLNDKIMLFYHCGT